MTGRVLRYSTPDDLAVAAAQRLLDQLIEHQSRKDLVHLCLTGGGIANRMYQHFAQIVPDSELDPRRLHLWWGDERFLPTADPERNSLQALAILARTLNLAPSQTHPMPTKDGKRDPDEAAYAYAAELGDTRFDICLLGMGPDGHVASIFPDHPSFRPTTSLAFGVTESPKPPSERISLSFTALNRSDEIWLLISGSHKAHVAARAFNGDQSLPAAHVQGRDNTLWFVDKSAAAELPYYQCQL